MTRTDCHCTICFLKAKFTLTSKKSKRITFVKVSLKLWGALNFSFCKSSKLSEQGKYNKTRLYVQAGDTSAKATKLVGSITFVYLFYCILI